MRAKTLAQAVAAAVIAAGRWQHRSGNHIRPFLIVSNVTLAIAGMKAAIG